jgi:hypothetical protein
MHGAVGSSGDVPAVEPATTDLYTVDRTDIVGDSGGGGGGGEGAVRTSVESTGGAAGGGGGGGGGEVQVAAGPAPAAGGDSQILAPSPANSEGAADSANTNTNGNTTAEHSTQMHMPIDDRTLTVAVTTAGAILGMGLLVAGVVVLKAWKKEAEVGVHGSQSKSWHGKNSKRNSKKQQQRQQQQQGSKAGSKRRRHSSQEMADEMETNLLTEAWEALSGNESQGDDAHTEAFLSSSNIGKQTASSLSDGGDFYDPNMNRSNSNSTTTTKSNGNGGAGNAIVPQWQSKLGRKPKQALNAAWGQLLTPNVHADADDYVSDVEYDDMSAPTLIVGNASRMSASSALVRYLVLRQNLGFARGGCLGSHFTPVWVHTSHLFGFTLHTCCWLEASVIQSHNRSGDHAPAVPIMHSCHL